MRALIWLAWLATAGADLKSTHDAIARGAHESNPALQQSAVERDAIVLSSAAGTACMLACGDYYKQHPRITWTLTAVVGGLHTWATIHNFHQGKH